MKRRKRNKRRKAIRSQQRKRKMEKVKAKEDNERLIFLYELETQLFKLCKDHEDFFDEDLEICVTNLIRNLKGIREKVSNEYVSETNKKFIKDLQEFCKSYVESHPDLKIDHMVVCFEKVLETIKKQRGTDTKTQNYAKYIEPFITKW
jgi:16S rRNA C1402 (ribose-2'-O) methylase RsmI